VFRIDTGDFPQRLTLAATIIDQGWRGKLMTHGATVELEQVQSVYYRRPTQFVFPGEMSQADALLATAESRHGFGGIFAALDTLWVNDPSLTARAEYKPLQLRVAVRAGLLVPPTLVTSDYSAAVEFAAAHGPVVYKPLSSLVLGDQDGQPLITYTTRVDMAAVDPLQFALTTNLLQRWVPKVVDCRVTMVGRRPFAAAVKADSPAGYVDWRADYSCLTYSPIEVPDHVTTGMIHYLNTFGLRFAAFDFGIDRDGRWWFYEANANGEWLWIEIETGLEISASIAELLTEGTTR
jgi:ATP-grasp ribosomal peptide maturase